MNFAMNCFVFFVLNLMFHFCTSYKNHSYPKKYCLAVDSNPYLFFGSKTAYENVRSTAGSESACRPIQFWSLFRHGSRYPTQSDIDGMKFGEDTRDDIIAFYASGSPLPMDSLCDNDLADLKAWKWDPNIQRQANNLTKEGWKELKSLAERYKRRYPTIFDGKYSPDDYYFRHTVEQRTTASCAAFIEGLFGNETARIVQIQVPQERDEVIRPYAMCDAWLQDVKENPERHREEKNFKKSKNFIKILKDVSARLGYNKTLSSEDIEGMFNNCRYDKSWYPYKTSPWCGVFNKIELLFLDYLDDLKAYYKSGYGHPYNPKLGCMPLQHMMETFDTTVQDKEAKPKAIHMFSHDSMINMMYTAMGYSQDQKRLRGKNYEDFLINRLFRSSWNTPFSGNVAAILHRCSNDLDDYQVQFFINERPMEIEGCEFGLCSWSYLKNLFAPSFSCNLDFCKNDALPLSTIFKI